MLRHSGKTLSPVARKVASPRHLLIDGRKWRRSDPTIPDTFRAELVGELMDARRAVGDALRKVDADAERAARARVKDAKVALGERGAPWWEEPSEDQRAVRIAATARTLLRHRGASKTICPSDVARAVGGDRWRSLMTQVRAVVADLVSQGTLELRQKGKVVAPGRVRGPVRIAWRAGE